MKLVLASNNNKKLIELRGILSVCDVEVLSQSEAGLNLEVEETGTTFAENALLKASAACKALNMPAVADDSGLVVEALNGEPGVYSARYGGDFCKNDKERTAHLLKNMNGKTDRRAKFVSSIACVFPNGDVLTAEGECYGVINLLPRGEGGFGYDPIFEFPDLGKTMAEISAEEKNDLSHRGNALKKFKEKLRKYNADK